MLKRVAEAIFRYSMFAPGQRVGVAVSGGADSVCLLHVLVELAPRWALKLAVLHFDHQLRGEESRRDAEFVRKLADSLSLPFEEGAADVGRIRAENRDNLEQAARQARREFLLGLLSDGRADRVALGHTRSDQAETVLFRLLRGSGPTGIAGMLPVTADGFVRPLLGVDRAEVEQYLRERGIAWREDSTNKDPAFARNRIRHELLPALEREWNPALAENLARMAILAQEDEAYWQQEIDRLAEAHITQEPTGILLRADFLKDLPRAVARRLVRRAIQRARGDLRRTEFQHVERILELSEGREGHGRIQAPGLEVFRSFEWLRLAPPEKPGLQPRNYRLPLSVPGRFAVPGGDSTLCLEIIEKTYRPPDCGYNTGEWELDWSKLPKPLELRNWRPGDQYRPAGHAADERIKVLFQRARVPVWERRSWPLITSGESILWARRFGPAAEYAAGSQSHLVLRVGEI